ncbi:hypothetical protein IC614_11160 [Allosphingosinicella flava]|uniref:Uncharacterized protein n=1 Tax=Allosphingosinicella flava TaxID=2771430 RepID=A0A7T2GJ96_9SPHN|nr:hypothetical protein [Sphingosinicella flava]QPQ54861.1 hypothetical protein IC614_11160 [Sphingosinicella flava]
MPRIILGSLAAAIAMFIVGFIFYATPLVRFSYATLGNTQAATVQQALAANLPKTGTYFVPNPDESSEQTVMYGQGPIATIHYNRGGFAAMDTGALVGGLVLNFIVALLIGSALIGIDARVPDFASRARLVLIFSLAASALMHLGGPLFYHHDWPHAIYAFIADAATLAVAGLVIARWFLPRGVKP